jgi:putative ABC transport system ATP-binding protein
LPASSKPSDLILEGCTKAFHAPGRELVRAIDKVDLTVQHGTYVSVIGSNGAGKSTMLSMIAGSLLADEGRILVRGQDVTTLPSWKRIRVVSRVRQNPQDNMVSTLTVEENFALALAGKRGRFGLRMPPATRVRAIAGEVLQPLGMGLENRMSAISGSLSGGQRQAIAVAMASLGSPAVMLLDEHVAALDPNSAARVNAATEQIVRDGQITSLTVTHDMGHALKHADRLLMMHQGRIVLDYAGTDLAGLTVRDLQQRFVSLSGGSLSDAAMLSAEADVHG